MKSLAALAKEAGYDLSEEDFILKNEQLGEDELAGAAGGWDGMSHHNPSESLHTYHPQPFCIEQEDERIRREKEECSY